MAGLRERLADVTTLSLPQEFFALFSHFHVVINIEKGSVKGTSFTFLNERHLTESSNHAILLLNGHSAMNVLQYDHWPLTTLQCTVVVPVYQCLCMHCIVSEEKSVLL